MICSMYFCLYRRCGYMIMQCYAIYKCFDLVNMYGTLLLVFISLPFYHVICWHFFSESQVKITFKLFGCYEVMYLWVLTHWGRVTRICIGNLTLIGSDNGLSPDRRQAIIWTNARILLIGPLGTNFSENWIEILTYSFKKMRLNV